MWQHGNDVWNYLVVGSPFLVAIGGEPSGRVTERIVRQKEAADITHIGSQCELSLKIPGTLSFSVFLIDMKLFMLTGICKSL